MEQRVTEREVRPGKARRAIETELDDQDRQINMSNIEIDHRMRKKHSNLLSSRSTNPFQGNAKAETEPRRTVANVGVAHKSKKPSHDQSAQEPVERGKRKSINRRSSSLSSSSPNPSPPKVARQTIKLERTPELLQGIGDSMSPDSRGPETPSPCPNRRSSAAVSLQSHISGSPIPFALRSRSVSIAEAISIANESALHIRSQYQLTRVDAATAVTTTPRCGSSKRSTPKSKTPKSDPPKKTPSKSVTINPRTNKTVVQALREDTKQKVEQRKRATDNMFWGGRVPDRPAIQRAASAKIGHAKHLENLEQELRDKNDERERLKQKKQTEIARLTEKLKELENHYDEKLSKNLTEKNAMQKELAHVKAWPQHEYTSSSFHRLP